MVLLVMVGLVPMLGQALLEVWSAAGDTTSNEFALNASLMAMLGLLGGWLAWRMGDQVIIKPASKLPEATRRIGQGQLDALHLFGSGSSGLG